MPQGGDIGPLLFIIYINDITTEIDIHTNVVLFADHTKVFSQSNYDLLLSLDRWLESTKRKLAPNKCYVPNIH